MQSRASKALSDMAAPLLTLRRADVLDPALLRPGRFDRRVAVERPDRVGREQVGYPGRDAAALGCACVRVCACNRRARLHVSVCVCVRTCVLMHGAAPTVPEAPLS